MTNRFSKYFTDDLTPKLVVHRFFQLAETVERGSQEEKELNEAYMAASTAAEGRAAEYIRKTVEEYRKKGMDCFVCYDA